MLNRRGLLSAFSALLVLSPTFAKAAYLPLTTPLLNALDYKIKGDGTTDDSAAVQTFMNFAVSKSACMYFPGGGKQYNMMGNSAQVPDGGNVLCQSDALFIRSLDTTIAPNPTVAYGASFTASMFALGNHCTWTGGVLQNTAIFTASATSQNIATIAALPGGSSITLTIGTGLNIDVGFTDFRFWSAANPVNRFEGRVNGYNTVTGVVSMTDLFTAGSGTHTDWQVTFGGLFQCPMVLHNVAQTIVQNVRVTGFWYVGLMMEAWNSTGAALLTTDCTFRNCWAESVQNRPYYMYGNCSDNLIDACWALGGSGISDYGANFNPANVGVGAANSIIKNFITNFHSVGTWGQGIAFGAACIENIALNCTINGVIGPAGVGCLVESVFNGTANQNAQFNKFIGCNVYNAISQGFLFVGANQGGAWNCTALVCGSAFVVSQTSDATPIQCTGVTIDGCEGLSSTSANFTVSGNSSEINLNNIKSNAAPTGVLITTNPLNTIVTGRTYGNTLNYSNTSASTIATGLVQV